MKQKQTLRGKQPRQTATRGKPARRRRLSFFEAMQVIAGGSPRYIRRDHCRAAKRKRQIRLSDVLRFFGG